MQNRTGHYEMCGGVTFQPFGGEESLQHFVCQRPGSPWSGGARLGASLRQVHRPVRLPTCARLEHGASSVLACASLLSPERRAPQASGRSGGARRPLEGGAPCVKTGDRPIPSPALSSCPHSCSRRWAQWVLLAITYSCPWKVTGHGNKLARVSGCSALSENLGGILRAS